MKTKLAALCIAALLLILACLAVACGGGAEPTQPATTTTAPTTAPALNGATLLNERCARCHSLDRVKQAKKTLAEWQTTVTRMRGNGAILTDAEAQALIEHLAQTYGK